MLLPDHAEHQDQHAYATKNMIQQPTLAEIANQATCLIIVVSIRTVDVQESQITVLLKMLSKALNNHAMHADHALLVKLLLEEHAKLKEHALATNNTILPQTLAQTAHQDNWTQFSPVDAKLYHNHVTLVEESNWLNNNAIAAELAQPDKYLEETHVLFQDQLADASSLWTHKTNARDAKLEHWLIQPTQDVLLK